jgi:hypothetical protein
LCARPKKLCAWRKNLVYLPSGYANNQKSFCTTQKLRLSKKILRMSRNIYPPPKSCANVEIILWPTEEIVHVTRKFSAPPKEVRLTRKSVRISRKFCASRKNFADVQKNLCASKKL